MEQAHETLAKVKAGSRALRFHTYPNPYAGGYSEEYSLRYMPEEDFYEYRYTHLVEYEAPKVDIRKLSQGEALSLLQGWNWDEVFFVAV